MATDLMDPPPAATGGWPMEPPAPVPSPINPPPGPSIGGAMDALNHPSVGAPERHASDVETSPRGVARWRDALALSKPRIVTMILVTTVCTGIIGAGGGVSWVSMAWLLVGTGLVAAAAGAANQIWERRIDQHMGRTASRPLPSGRMRAAEAMVWMAAALAIGTGVLAWRFGVVPAAVGVATWALYLFVYTPMKTRTTINTAVGAVAGALPVLIGYTATGGGFGDWAGWLLLAVLAAWQFPHFMAIAWMYRDQYAEAGFRMTPSVHRDGWSAAVQAIVGAAALMAASVGLVAMVTGWGDVWSIGYLVLGSILVVAASWPMLAASIRFYRDRNDATARRLLRSSLWVLPAVLAVATAGVFVR